MQHSGRSQVHSARAVRQYDALVEEPAVEAQCMIILRYPALAHTRLTLLLRDLLRLRQVVQIVSGVQPHDADH